MDYEKADYENAKQIHKLICDISDVLINNSNRDDIIQTKYNDLAALSYTLGYVKERLSKIALIDIKTIERMVNDYENLGYKNAAKITKALTKILDGEDNG